MKDKPIELRNQLSQERISIFPTLGEIKKFLNDENTTQDFQTTDLWDKIVFAYENCSMSGNKVMRQRVKYWEIQDNTYLIPNLINDKITAVTILWVDKSVNEEEPIGELSSFTYGLIRDNNPTVLDEKAKGFLGLRQGLVNDLPVIDSSMIYTDTLRVLGKVEPDLLCSFDEQVFCTKMRKLNLTLSGINTTCFSDDSMVSIMTQSTNIEINATEVSIAILGDMNHLHLDGKPKGFMRVSDTGEHNTIITNKQSTFIAIAGTATNIETRQDHAMIANASSQSNFILKGGSNKVVDLGINNMIHDDSDKSKSYQIHPVREDKDKQTP